MIADFFRKVFGSAPEGAVAVITALPAKDSAAFDARDAVGLEGAARVAVGAEQDAYFGTCLLGDDWDGEGRGKKRDLRHGTCLWVDVDVAGPAHKAENLPASFDEAAALLDAVPASPTILVDSGHGLHAYWVLDEAVSFGRAGASSPTGKRFVAAVAALQGLVRARARAAGLTVDDTSDPTRILRVPGTVNLKVEGERAPVRTVLDDGPTHDFEKLALALGVGDGLVVPAPPVDLAPVERPAWSPRDDAAAIDEVRDRLRRLRNEQTRKVFEKVLAGESFAAVERDRELQRVCSVLAAVAPDFRPEALAEVLRPSLSAWSREPGAAKTEDEEVAKAVDKVARSQEDLRQKRAEREQVDARIAATLGVQPPADVPDDAELGKYSYDDLARLARAVGCDRDALGRRWIVQHKSAYFVLVDGEYRSPLSHEELEVSLRRDLRRAPVDFWIEKADGKGTRPASLREILGKHATVARHLESDLSVQRSFYRSEDETFVEAVCPVRDLTPRFDPTVGAWLGLLGGVEAEKLLDWIATATRLDRQTCAIYFSGPAGSGKTVLANGLSRLWTTGGPTELRRILDNFNEDLTRCPLVFADEHLPANFRGQRSSAELRQLIGSNTRTLNRKFMPQSPLRGAIRFVLAANNERLLAFNEDLSPDDREAVAIRFLHVDTRLADGFFEGLPDRKAPTSWVEGDAIARHALWLRDNRQVADAGRFLVEGSAAKIHQHLATGGKNSAVVEWLAKFLCASPDVRRGIEAKGTIRVGDRRFLANAIAISDNWATFVRSENVPNVTKIGSALTALSTGESRVGRCRVRDLDVDLILSWMESNGVGNVDDARVLVEAPRGQKEEGHEDQEEA